MNINQKVWIPQLYRDRIVSVWKKDSKRNSSSAMKKLASLKDVSAQNKTTVPHFSQLLTDHKISRSWNLQRRKLSINTRASTGDMLHDLGTAVLHIAEKHFPSLTTNISGPRLRVVPRTTLGWSGSEEEIPKKNTWKIRGLQIKEEEDFKEFEIPSTYYIQSENVL